MNMETVQNAVVPKELLVTGVSRSGRVRKKSSKLLDFQSTDEVEKKSKRTSKYLSHVGSGRLSYISAGISFHNSEEFDTTDVTLDDDELQDELETDVDEQFAKASANSGFAGVNSDDEIDELVADLVEGVEAESLEHADNIESKVRQSLYMTEKANKRKILRDGKVVTGKMERKDKGKSRYTAYSMWAREFRKTSKFSKNQDLDFSNAARRLGELWANVSNKEKSTWRRKAKIQATKAKARDKASIHSTVTVAPVTSPFFNRATTSRTKKLEAERQKSPPAKLKELGALQTKRKFYNSAKRTIVVSGGSKTKTNLTHFQKRKTKHSPSSSSSNSKVDNKKIFYSTTPINAAAHLKLLGESLTIIGERLKEHDGQIAVSGSLSVLLDSLLCSMGPLMCLTTYLPGMANNERLKKNLEATLDNIAYIMPGL